MVLSTLRDWSASWRKARIRRSAKLVDALAFPHVHPDQGLDLALERMGTNQIEILPVVNRADVHKLEGILTLRDVLDAYGVSARDRA